MYCIFILCVYICPIRKPTLHAVTVMSRTHTAKRLKETVEPTHIPVHTAHVYGPKLLDERHSVGVHIYVCSLSGYSFSAFKKQRRRGS